MTPWDSVADQMEWQAREIERLRALGEEHLRKLENEWLERVQRAARDVDLDEDVVFYVKETIDHERNLRLIERLRREAEEKRNTL